MSNFENYTEEEIKRFSRFISENRLRFKTYDEEAYIEIINKYGVIPRFMDIKTPAICLAAVKARGEFLEYVEDQTPELCMAAVKNLGYALRFVK